MAQLQIPSVSRDGNKLIISNIDEHADILKIYKDGSLYDTVRLPPKPETWVINDALNASSAFGEYSHTTTWYRIPFSAGGRTFADFGIYAMWIRGSLNNAGIYFRDTALEYVDVYRNAFAEGSWTDQAYRTVTFEEPPTGDLLTWLQANAVKQ